MKNLIGALLPRTTESARSGVMRGSCAFARIMLPLVATFLCTSTGLAVTKTSQGTGNWSAITWSPSGLPASTDDVVIRAGDAVTVSDSRSCNTLVVSSSIAGVDTTLTISSSGSLTVGTGTGAVTIGQSVDPSGSESTILDVAGTLNCGPVSMVSRRLSNANVNPILRVS